MPKKGKEIPVALSPWMLCVWRGESDRCHYALVAFEYAALGPPSPVTMRGARAMFVDPLGMVAWKHYPPKWRNRHGEERFTAELAVPTEVQTGVPQMLDYFKRRLLLVGGHPRAYEEMGIPKPIVTQLEGDGDPKKVAELSDLYQRAAKLLGASVGDLREKYSHLNRGLQAMNLRNRLRAKGHNV